MPTMRKPMQGFKSNFSKGVSIHQLGAFFVVGEKRNIHFKVMEDKYYNNPESGILAGQLIEFTGYLTH